MSVEASNVIPMDQKKSRTPGQRWTSKRIDALKAEQFNAGYTDGHADGWRECQQQKPRPFVDFFAGVLLTACAWGLDRWVF